MTFVIVFGFCLLSVYFSSLYAGIANNHDCENAAQVLKVIERGPIHFSVERPEDPLNVLITRIFPNGSRQDIIMLNTDPTPQFLDNPLSKTYENRTNINTTKSGQSFIVISHSSFSDGGDYDICFTDYHTYREEKHKKCFMYKVYIQSAPSTPNITVLARTTTYLLIECFSTCDSVPKTPSCDLVYVFTVNDSQTEYRMGGDKLLIAPWNGVPLNVTCEVHGSDGYFGSVSNTHILPGLLQRPSKTGTSQMGNSEEDASETAWICVLAITNLISFAVIIYLVKTRRQKVTDKNEESALKETRLMDGVDKKDILSS